MNDKSFVRAFFSLLSFLMTTGWFIYALIIHDWLLAVAIISVVIGTAIGISLRESK